MKKIFAIVLLLGILLPALSFAAANSFPYWGPLLSCTGIYKPGDINYKTDLPPCQNVCQIFDTFQNVLYFAATIIVFVIAPIIMVVGGIMIMTAGGSEERMKKGRDALWGAVWGIVLTFAAFLILNTFIWLIGSSAFKSQVSWPNISCNPADFPTGTGN